MEFPVKSHDVILLLFEEFNVSRSFVSTVAQWLDFPLEPISGFSTKLLRIDHGNIEFMLICTAGAARCAAILTICMDSFSFAETGFSRRALKQLFREIDCEEKYALFASSGIVAGMRNSGKYDHLFPFAKLRDYFASSGSLRGKFIAEAIDSI